MGLHRGNFLDPPRGLGWAQGFREFGFLGFRDLGNLGLGI